MRIRYLVAAAVTAAGLLVTVSGAWAQQPPAAPPPKPLSGSAGFGLSLTSGNSDTVNINATIDSIYDPKTKNVMKWSALFLRGKQNGVLAVNRLSAMFRDEYALSDRTYFFGQIDALHDTFKAIDYLYAPAAGVGYKAIATMRTQLSADVGVGVVVEQDTGAPSHTSGAITLSQKLVHQLTQTATLKEAVSSLLKTNNLSDGLYTFQFGVAAKISSRLQLAVDVLDTFKNQPFDPALKKNDVALVTSIVAKY